MLTKNQVSKLLEISQKIAEGANVFLFKEYLILMIFILLFSIVIIFCCEERIGVFYTFCAFIVGATTSIFCGFIGMRIAVVTNYRVAYKAQ